MTKREKIKQRFGGLCAYSGTPLEDDWQIDHLVPKSMGGTDDLDNLIPAQKIINHYKRALPVDIFKSWFMTRLHERLAKLPINPHVERSKKRKDYLQKVAAYFGVTPENPFSGKFYFECFK